MTSTSRPSNRTMRLPHLSACWYSFRQAWEEMEGGLITNTNASAASMARSMSVCQGADGGMSSQSTHTSRLSAVSRACSLRTRSASCREYETKTSAMRRHLRTGCKDSQERHPRGSERAEHSRGARRSVFAEPQQAIEWALSHLGSNRFTIRAHPQPVVDPGGLPAGCLSCSSTWSTSGRSSQLVGPRLRARRLRRPGPPLRAPRRAPLGRVRWAVVPVGTSPEDRTFLSSCRPGTFPWL